MTLGFEEKKERGVYGRVLVKLPSSALAIAAGDGGSDIVAPPVTVNVPDAIASLISLDKCIDNEKSPNWTRLSMVVRTIGLGVPVSGLVEVQETVIEIVFWLNETRSIPCTVACRDAVVRVGSTWKLALVELPMNNRVGI